MQKGEQIDTSAKKSAFDGTLSIKSDSTTHAQVSVTSIPELRAKLDGGLDLVALLGFVITALIVLATTYFTIRNFKKSTDSQERISQQRNEMELKKAKSEALSKNRQEWIDELRNSVSEYIAVAKAIDDLHHLNQGLSPHDSNLPKDQAVMNGREWAYKYHLAKTEAIKLRAKIALLSNPKESDFHDLLDLIDELYKSAIGGEASLDVKTDRLISLTQKILKLEWVRVKNFE